MTTPFEAELARRHLCDFGKLLLPGYEAPAHVRLLTEHLEALERREIRRLAIFTPPRHSKSTHVSQLLPAWWLGRNPSDSIILTSYGAELAEGNSRRARGLLVDPRWPFPEVAVSAQSAAVNRWHTTAGGGVIAAGVGGGITGHGAHALVIDDPVRDRADADSPAVQASSWEWYSQVALTRLMPNGVVLLCQTRWSEGDLAGRILNSPGADEWTVLSLPALALEDDPLGRTEGEALWPEWYPADVLEEYRRDLGERAFSALYMQSPTPDRGNVFQRAWFEGRYATPPAGLRIVQAVDSAFKTGTSSDWSVIATWGTDGRFMYVLDVRRARLEYPQLVAAIRAEAAEWSPSVILVEDAASGQSVVQSLRQETGLPIVPVKAGGSKVSRAEGVSPLFESGRVLLPEQAPSWLGPWIEEHVTFPAGRHDDQVDVTSMALARLRTMTAQEGGVAGAVTHDPRGGEETFHDPRGESAAERPEEQPGLLETRDGALLRAIGEEEPDPRRRESRERGVRPAPRDVPGVPGWWKRLVRPSVCFYCLEPVPMGHVMCWRRPDRVSCHNRDLRAERFAATWDERLDLIEDAKGPSVADRFLERYGSGERDAPPAGVADGTGGVGLL